MFEVTLNSNTLLKFQIRTHRFKTMFTSGPKVVLEKEDLTDNCSVNIAFFGDQLYAMTESLFIRRIDPKTLETIGNKTRLGDFVAINHATAHPHILEDGTALNMGNNYRHKNGPHYCIIEVPPSYESSGIQNPKDNISSGFHILFQNKINVPLA